MDKNLNNLSYLIPDYINGNIDDKEVLSVIENEININPEFKKIYENFRNTLNFIHSVNVSEPPDYYFNTILPRINNRIDARSKSGFSLISYLRNIRSHWKYLIPALPVILILLIYRISFYKITNIADSSENYSNKNTENGVIMNKDMNDNSHVNESEDIVQRDNDQSNSEINTFNTLKSKKVKNNEQNKFNNIEENIIENSEETDFFSKDEEELNNLENEFLELNEESQIEILNNLKHEKL